MTALSYDYRDETRFTEAEIERGHAGYAAPLPPGPPIDGTGMFLLGKVHGLQRALTRIADPKHRQAIQDALAEAECELAKFDRRAA